MKGQIGVRKITSLEHPGSIYILADNTTDKAGRRIASRLCSSFACTDMGLNVIYRFGSVDSFDSSAVIILLGGEKSAACCPIGIPVAISSSNRSALRILGSRKHHAIICGMYARDTVTLSSYDRDCALVALQRTLLSLGGEEIEPKEIKVHLKHSIPSSDIPLITAALLINDCCDKNEFEI